MIGGGNIRGGPAEEVGTPLDGWSVGRVVCPDVVADGHSGSREGDGWVASGVRGVTSEEVFGKVAVTVAVAVVGWGGAGESEGGKVGEKARGGRGRLEDREILGSSRDLPGGDKSVGRPEAGT